MKKLWIALLFLLVPVAGWGATLYIIKDPGNAGKVCYNSGSWPEATACTGATANNTDLNTAIAAASPSDTIRISGGASGLSYTGTEIGASGRVDLDRAITITNSTDSGHSGVVTIEAGSNSLLYVSADGATISNLKLSVANGNTGGIYLSYITNAITFDTVNFAIGNSATITYGVWVNAAGKAVTFTNCTGSCGSDVPPFNIDLAGTITWAGGTFTYAGQSTQHFILITGAGDASIHDMTFTGPGGDYNPTTGAQGIRILGAVTSCSIYNNTLSALKNHAVLVTGSAYPQIYNNTINDGKNSGIYCLNDSASIYGNTIYNIGGGSSLAEGIRVEGDSCLVYNNNIYSIIREGIAIKGASSSVYGNTVHDCWNESLYGAGGAGCGIYIDTTGTSNLVYLNNVYNNYLGIQVNTSGGAGGDKIYKNIVNNSYINSIDIASDPGVNPIWVYNNKILHSPDATKTSAGDPIGHGISVQGSGTRAKIFNNSIFVNKTGGATNNCQGLYFSDTSTNVAAVNLDYNQIHGIPGAVLGRVIGTAGTNDATTIAGWRTIVQTQADSKIVDMADGATPEKNSNLMISGPPSKKGLWDAPKFYTVPISGGDTNYVLWDTGGDTILWTTGGDKMTWQ